ncbi:hypothetical protein pb186bvf_008794 [Paramecium bursaria]
MNILSPCKIAGPALQNSPFQQLRSVSTDCKQTIVGLHRDENQLKIKKLIEENEKQVEIVKALMQEEENYKQQQQKYQHEIFLLKREIDQLRSCIHIYEKEKDIQTKVIREQDNQIKNFQAILQDKCQQTENMQDQIGALEEHIYQLLERNQQLQQSQEESEKIDNILEENQQLRDLNDQMADRLRKMEDQLYKFKTKIDEQNMSQDTERKDYLTQLQAAKQKIRNMETKIQVLTEDNQRRRILFCCLSI